MVKYLVLRYPDFISGLSKTKIMSEIKNKNILITGAAGFIGSHLTDRLIKNNNIICIDDFNDFYSPEIKKNNIKSHINKDNFVLYEADITDFNALSRVFDENKIDLVVHIAARAGISQSLRNPLLYTRVNVDGTANLLELTRKYNIKKFIFASSSSVYGSQKQIPFSEEMKIDRQISLYAATKAASEQICHTFSHLYDIQINCLRFFTVYGPGQRPDLAVYKFSKLILEGKPLPVFGNGTTKRDYTYIDDIIEGVIGAINYNKAPFEIFNLGESRAVELKYLIELLEDNLEKKAIIDWLPEQPCDMPVTYADISKAREFLGYNPKTEIETGIKKFVEWFNERYKFSVKL